MRWLCRERLRRASLVAWRVAVASWAVVMFVGVIVWVVVGVSGLLQVSQSCKSHHIAQRR